METWGHTVADVNCQSCRAAGTKKLAEFRVFMTLHEDVAPFFLCRECIFKAVNTMVSALEAPDNG